MTLEYFQGKLVILDHIYINQGREGHGKQEEGYGQSKDGV